MCHLEAGLISLAWPLWELACCGPAAVAAAGELDVRAFAAANAGLAMQAPPHWGTCVGALLRWLRLRPRLLEYVDEEDEDEVVVEKDVLGDLAFSWRRLLSSMSSISRAACLCSPVFSWQLLDAPDDCSVAWPRGLEDASPW